MATNVGSIEYDVKLDSSQFKREAAVVDATAKSTAANIGNSFSSVASVIGKTALGIGAFVGVLGGFGVKTASEFETTSKSMQVLIGNTEVANKLFGDLAKYANTTPFEFGDISKGAKTLLGFGISAQDVLPRIKMLGDLSAATGADFRSLATVFGQVNATGRLMGQDALQLINNNIPITTILAKKLGISVQEVKAQMEDGAISADMFNEALVNVTKEGGFAFRGTDQLAQTFAGRLSTLKDSAKILAMTLVGVKFDPDLGLVVQPGGVFDSLSKLMPIITEQAGKIAPAVAAGMQWLVDNGDTVKGIIGGVAAAFVAAQGAAVGFAIAASFNPFTLLAAAIAAVVGGLVYLEIKYGVLSKIYNTLLKPALTDLWNNIKELGVAIQPLVSIMNEAAASVGGWGNVIKFVLGAALLLIVAPVVAFIFIISRAVDTITGAIDAIKRFASLVIFAFNSIPGGVGNAISSVISIVGGLPGRAIAVLGNLGRLLEGSGNSLVQGFVNGIKGAAGKVVDAVKGVVNAARAYFPFSPAKKGPFSGKGWTAYSGVALMEGFAQGIQSSTGLVGSALNSMNTPTLTPSSVGGSSVADIQGDGRVINNIGTINISSDVDGERLLKRLGRDDEITSQGVVA